jgi:hypothetical protein
VLTDMQNEFFVNVPVGSALQQNYQDIKNEE